MIWALTIFPLLFPPSFLRLTKEGSPIQGQPLSSLGPSPVPLLSSPLLPPPCSPSVPGSSPFLPFLLGWRSPPRGPSGDRPGRKAGKSPAWPSGAPGVVGIQTAPQVRGLPEPWLRILAASLLACAMCTVYVCLSVSGHLGLSLLSSPSACSQLTPTHLCLSPPLMHGDLEEADSPKCGLP